MVVNRLDGAALRSYDVGVIATSYRYIVKAPGVRSGNAIVEGTRIGVHDIVGLIQSGAMIEEAARSFASLSKAQIYESLAYYEDHRAEIDPLIKGQLVPLEGACAEG